jgi:hypothetical protein
MELLLMLRRLWRRRLALGVGLALAAAIAVAVGGAPASASAVAWTRVALDTPTSELVEAAPAGADTLPWRASLLVHLMGTDSAQQELAQRLGVPPDEVAVVDTALAVPDVPSSMALAATKAATPNGVPYVLTLALPNASLPLISVEAAAPERAGARRLAEAAVAVFESQASPGGAYRSLIRTDGGAAPRLQPFVVLVQEVAPIQVEPVVASQRTKQIAAAVFVLGLWCAGVKLFTRLLRREPRVARASAALAP